jgi:hypothetical protein
MGMQRQRKSQREKKQKGGRDSEDREGEVSKEIGREEGEGRREKRQELREKGEEKFLISLSAVFLCLQYVLFIFQPSASILQFL